MYLGWPEKKSDDTLQRSCRAMKTSGNHKKKIIKIFWTYHEKKETREPDNHSKEKDTAGHPSGTRKNNLNWLEIPNVCEVVFKNII